jgi:ankyrin repeat protein
MEVAILAGSIEAVQSVIQSEGKEALRKSLDNYGHAALQFAIVKRMNAMALWLISNGAPPAVKDDDDSTPLYSAVTSGLEDVVGALLSCRVDIHLNGDAGGKVPIVAALDRKQFSIAKLLIKHKVDLLCLDKQKRCGLHMVLASSPTERSELVNLLQSEGLLHRAANGDAMQWLRFAMQAFPSPESAVVCERLFEQLPKLDVAQTNVLFGEAL